MCQQQVKSGERPSGAIGITSGCPFYLQVLYRCCTGQTAMYRTTPRARFGGAGGAVNHSRSHSRHIESSLFPVRAPSARSPHQLPCLVGHRRCRHVAACSPKALPGVCGWRGARRARHNEESHAALAAELEVPDIPAGGGRGAGPGGRERSKGRDQRRGRPRLPDAQLGTQPLSTRWAGKMAGRQCF